MKTITMLFVVVVSILVGIGRFFVPGHGLSLPGSYEAFAHIWVGVLGTIGVIGPWRRIAWAILAVLTALETVMFLSR